LAAARWSQPPRLAIARAGAPMLAVAQSQARMIRSPAYWTLPSGRRFAAVGGCLLAILGFKFLLIARLGSPTPYFDQWAEPFDVYLPYLSHTLSFERLVLFHNEHRLLLTRLTALILLIFNGTWDPILQMLVGAVVHVAAIGFLLVALGRILKLTPLIFLLSFALLFYAVPFDWDNTLSGFQIQFYFLLLLSALSLLLLARAEGWSAEWLVGTLLATLGYFSVASGALILPAAIALALVQMALGRRKGAREFAGLALHAAIAIIILHDLLAYAARGTTDASLRQLFSSLMISASWPIAARSWPVVLQIVPAALVYAPVLILTARTFRQRPELSDRRWFYIALGCWLALQLIALSFGRTGGTIQSRYTDIFLIGVILNFAALLFLLTVDEPRKLLRCGAAIWIFAVLLGAGQKAVVNVIDEVSFRYASGQRQTENVKRFLATDDFAALDNKPTFDIPFTDAGLLRDTLRNPTLRAILPAELTGVQQHHRMRNMVLSQGPMLIPLGLALLMIVALFWVSRSSGEPDFATSERD
jgi:hypothetical protein